jgi:hypothetical protein
MTKLANLKIDPRSLALVKIGLVKLDKDSKGQLTVAQFKKTFTNVMKQSDDQDVAGIILSYTQQTSDISNKELDDSLLNFERLNTLVEAYQFLPLIIKRDKNYSASIHVIMNTSSKP